MIPARRYGTYVPCAIVQAVRCDKVEVEIDFRENENERKQRFILQLEGFRCLDSICHHSLGPLTSFFARGVNFSCFFTLSNKPAGTIYVEGYDVCKYLRSHYAHYRGIAVPLSSVAVIGYVPRV